MSGVYETFVAKSRSTYKILGKNNCHLPLDYIVIVLEESVCFVFPNHKILQLFPTVRLVNLYNHSVSMCSYPNSFLKCSTLQQANNLHKVPYWYSLCAPFVYRCLPWHCNGQECDNDGHQFSIYIVQDGHFCECTLQRTQHLEYMCMGYWILHCVLALRCTDIKPVMLKIVFPEIDFLSYECSLV